MRSFVLMLMAAAALAIGGCAPMITESPGAGLSPVNAVSEGGDKHLMLFGYPADSERQMVHAFGDTDRRAHFA